MPALPRPRSSRFAAPRCRDSRRRRPWCSARSQRPRPGRSRSSCCATRSNRRRRFRPEGLGPELIDANSKPRAAPTSAACRHGPGCRPRRQPLTRHLVIPIGMYVGDSAAAVASGSYVCNKTGASLRRSPRTACACRRSTGRIFSMNVSGSRLSNRPPAFRRGLAVTLFLSGVVGATGAFADDDDINFRPGNLLIGRSVYDNNPANVVAGTTLLPPNCVAPNCVTATDSGAYPFAFNNNAVDASFGITSKIVLDQFEPSGKFINSLEVELPERSERRGQPARDRVVTSFPSKSEIALNLSTDGRVVTFMGYLAPINALDVSNSNTPGVVDPTNPVPGSHFRVVAEVDAHGHFHFTKTNAYSGNNGRAAILNDKNGANIVYTVGNAGNGANPQPNGIIIGAGAQILTAERTPLAAQTPGLPTPVGSFNITQLGLKADKTGKDTNFRGLTVSNNVIYVTKGSGSNGVNTVYFIDATGFDGNGKPLACPSGVGLPGATATLPAAPIPYDATKLQTLGVVPYNMCILKGFPTTLAKATTPPPSFPFGVWFADAKTLYVADEG